MRALFLSLLLLACSAPKDGSDAEPGPADSGSPTDSGGSDGSDGSDTASGGLNGTAPDSPLPAPDFHATNRDGGARDREDLLGHPTAMWFYPAASSAG